jgi:ATP phosphoribosyltransferase regulatory subunit
MTDKLPIRLPVGVRDFLPQATATRRAIAEALLSEFERWGYDRIITPAFEYADVLLRGLGADARAAAIRFVEPATGEVVALRPDITPQIARVAATRMGPAVPLRLCYEGSVLRLLAGARGQRELIQAGVELLGAPPPHGDAEVIALAGAALRAAKLEDVTIDVGHVALARAAVGDHAALREAVARKDEEAVASACRGARLSPTRRQLLVALPSLYGAPDKVLRRARALPLPRAMRAELDELERVLDLVRDQGYTGRLTVDLGEVRGFEYYTGVRFAGYVDGVGDAVIRGGRYDDLVGRYGAATPATGFAVDVEAIADAEKLLGVTAAPPPPGIMVIASAGTRRGHKHDSRHDSRHDKDQARAYQVATALRREGLRVVVGQANGAGEWTRLVLDDRSLGPLAPAVAEARAGHGAALAAALRAGAAGPAEPTRSQ